MIILIRGTILPGSIHFMIATCIIFKGDTFAYFHFNSATFGFFLQDFPERHGTPFRCNICPDANRDKFHFSLRYQTISSSQKHSGGIIARLFSIWLMVLTFSIFSIKRSNKMSSIAISLYKFYISYDSLESSYSFIFINA